MKKMGKKFLAGTAFAAAALTIAGCGIGQPEPDVYGPPAPAVYGPPEWFESGSIEPPKPAPDQPESETSEAETGETQTDNPAEGVYGPPEWFEQ